MSQNKNLWNSIQVKKPARSKFDLTHDVKMSCNMGNLVPIMNVEVLPGDHFNISNQNLIRFAPMIAPVMHRMDVSTHYFFVPNRILWSNWEDFITNTDTGSGVPVHPYLNKGFIYDSSNPDSAKFMEYFGIPMCSNSAAQDIKINPFPFIGYNRIYNEYYRDQNLISKITDTLIDGDNTSIAGDLILRNRAWEHDYFTSSLPFAQKGPSVNIPLGNIAGDVPVYRNEPTGGTDFVQLSGGSTIPLAHRPAVDGQYTNASGAFYAHTDGLNVGSGTINDLRKAYSLQKWLEKNARAGTRYVEQLLAHFFVRAQDSRLQRPEYICGSKSPVMVSEVLNNTGELGGLPQGNMAGHGIAVTSGNHGSYHAQEHGWIIGIMSVLPKPAYQQGIPRNYIKNDFLDYAWPEFANIGEQAVLNHEIFAYPNSGDTGVFGYVPRYSEMKYARNYVAGNFLDSLDYWHLGRIFATPPALNQDFIEVNPSDTTRIFAVTDDTVDHLFCQIVNNVTVVRALPFYGTPSV